MEPLVCRNCQETFSGRYCSTCGQKYMAVPYTFRSILDQAVSNIDFNRGFLVTFFFLFRNPGKVTSTYLSGDTRRFTNPGRYFVGVFTLAAFGLFLKMYFWGIALQPNGDGQATAPDALEALVTYLEPFLISIPWVITVAIMNYLLFPSGRNLAEHVIIALYFVLQLVMLSLLLWPLFFTASYFVIFIILLYMLWFNVSVFGGRWVLSIAKSLLSITVQMGSIALIGRIFFGIS